MSVTYIYKNEINDNQDFTCNTLELKFEIKNIEKK